jgi:hypothetical protein
MAYSKGEGRSQGTLFPVVLNDLVPAYHMCRYGLTPQLILTASLPATFESGALPESRIMPGASGQPELPGDCSTPLPAMKSGLNRLPRPGLSFQVQARLWRFRPSPSRAGCR